MHYETDIDKIKEQLARDKAERQKAREDEARRLDIPIEHLDRKPWFKYGDDNLTEEEKFERHVDNLDIPGSMDDGLATILYIIVMAIGIIFVDRLMIWIAATIVYLSHRFRRKLYKAKWDKEYKNKK